MEVVVTTGAIRRAKLQSNRHHQNKATHIFWRENCTYLICSDNYTDELLDEKVIAVHSNFRSLQCSDTVGWVAGEASGLQKNWLLVYSDWSFLHLTALVFITATCVGSCCIKNSLPFWFRIIWVLLEYCLLNEGVAMWLGDKKGNWPPKNLAPALAKGFVMRPVEVPV